MMTDEQAISWVREELPILLAKSDPMAETIFKGLSGANIRACARACGHHAGTTEEKANRLMTDARWWASIHGSII
jgi:hypothetical protein